MPHHTGRLWTNVPERRFAPPGNPIAKETGPDVQACCLKTTSTASKFSHHCRSRTRRHLATAAGRPRKSASGDNQAQGGRSRRRIHRFCFTAQPATRAAPARSAIDPTPASATTVEAEPSTTDFGAAAMERQRRPRSRPYGVAQPRRSNSHGQEAARPAPRQMPFDLPVPLLAPSAYADRSPLRARHPAPA